MPERPTGTVTFLFSDIEGSTRLLQRLRDRYDEVLSRHREILRDAFAEHDGHEIDAQGDAFFAVFGRARDAVSAAVAAQRALAAEPWAEDAPLRVRMGLHTGEPLVGGERYVGMGVNRGARICAAAHGGQVLLSNTTRELVEDDLPDDVRVIDLGEHRLKDLSRPERIFQLDIDGHTFRFPPLRTAETSAFAGREGELASAAAVAVPRRIPRRPALIAAGLAVIVAAVAVTLVVFGHGSGEKVAPNSVAALDSSGKVTAAVPVGATPVALTADTDGGLWTANLDDQSVTRVDPSSGQAVRSTPLQFAPTGLAAVAAISTGTNREFFSARMGCHVYQPVFGTDLAALCLRG